MNEGLEKLRIFGCMRIMALSAIDHQWIDINVSFAERGVF
jgi:hypothetical protein